MLEKGELQQSDFPHFPMGGACRLDLALRTDRLVPKAWQSDIQGIFEEALAITGMTGRLVFQHGREALLDLPQPGAAERTISA